MNNLLSLSVGCGYKKIANINTDLNRYCKPQIICDIHNLPFKDNMFNIVYCHHVLEHAGVNPEKALNELLRVTNNLIEIIVPHLLSHRRKSKGTATLKGHRNYYVMTPRFYKHYHIIDTHTDTEFIHKFLPIHLRPHDLHILLGK